MDSRTEKLSDTMLRVRQSDVHQHNAPTSEEWLHSVEQALQTSGARATLPRHKVLEWIAQTNAPFTAETIVEELDRRQGSCSRPTVYRTMEWLRSEGWVERIWSDESGNTYMRILPGHYHHLVCRECGDTYIISGCNIEDLLSSALADIDFEIQGHVLELYGRCRLCRVADQINV
ncbi:MAG: transcriptional repressor [Chloroflexi bacterium AL-W]|nr:transcriptional repressor [Chloroflexi bacterium AL-N1]NOK68022.1 transcriptional repressor [Chloroflexi bacterium AL-N10]NOK73362.1 transcriptional repressor [Chloroflexi bacterium AL-N5]NOK83276.1 transcriptional repressor [Chloroflexi bacterium AL-W]NOK87693.1 transcriptional repressor [Chloroflexi bacterium AL-N15]